MMQLIDQVKKIETYICECFEDWDLDDPVEEGYLGKIIRAFLVLLRKSFKPLRKYLAFVYLVTSKSFIAIKMGVNTSLFYLV